MAVMPHVTLTHDDVIEDFATLAPRCVLGGGAKVSRGAYIGAGAIIGQGLAVGELALVGMGAVVTRTTPREVWAGVPARRMRDAVIPGEPLTHSAEPDGSGLLTCQPSGYQLWMTAPQP